MSKQLEIVPPASREVARPASFDVESVFRLAIEKGGGVETIERLMAIRREMRAESAKAAFDDSMAAFQSSCPIIRKEKSGAKNAYKYAPLDAIISQVRDLIRQHGFSYRVTSVIDAGWVKVICTVTHSAGHSESSEFKVPIDSRNPMMNDPQRYAGSLTYAKRYAFCNAFGILTGDEDNDGTTKPKPPGPMSATSATKQRFLQLLAEWGLESKAQAFAIDMSFIMPDEPLHAWPLEHVPATKDELNELRKDIEGHA